MATQCFLNTMKRFSDAGVSYYISDNKTITGHSIYCCNSMKGFSDAEVSYQYSDGKAITGHSVLSLLV